MWKKLRHPQLVTNCVESAPADSEFDSQDVMYGDADGAELEDELILDFPFSEIENNINKMIEEIETAPTSDEFMTSDLIESTSESILDESVNLPPELVNVPFCEPIEVPSKFIEPFSTEPIKSVPVEPVESFSNGPIKSSVL